MRSSVRCKILILSNTLLGHNPRVYAWTAWVASCHPVANMKSPPALFALLALFLLAVAGTTLIDHSGAMLLIRADNTAPQSSIERREAAYRANNIGAALLEQYKAKEAVESFTRALQIKPDLLVARVNLSIALYYLPDADGAKKEAERGLKQDPNAPQPHYILGLIARGQTRFDDAIAEFQERLRRSLTTKLRCTIWASC